MRSHVQMVSRGKPNLGTEMWETSDKVIGGVMSPEAAGKRLQDVLASWYASQQ